MTAPRTLRERVLKRAPLRDDLALTLATDGLYRPVKRRAAICTVDVPAGALLAGGGVYYPPATGACVKWCAIGPEPPGASIWRFGLINVADLGASGAAGTATIRNVWPDAPIRGQFESFQFFGVGDFVNNLQQGTIAYPNVCVFPPNLFFFALGQDNVVGEGGMYVEEFIDGDEDL